MDKVKLYVEVIYRGKMEDGTGKYSALLEFIRKNGEVATVEERGCYTHTTKNRTYLYACISGLKRLKRACEIDLNINNAYIAESIIQGRLSTWAEYGWIKAAHSPLKNADLWKQLAGEIEEHLITVTQKKQTSYTNIMRFNLGNAALEEITDRRPADGEAPHCFPQPGRA